MAMNGLHNLLEVLETGRSEIHVDPAVGQRAKVSIQRMLDFARLHLPVMKGSGDA
jgi:quinolinate synthase